MAQCVFCAIARGTEPAAVVHRDDTVCAFLDKRPLFKGHVLVVPRNHHVTLGDLPVAWVPLLFGVARRLCRAVEQAMHAEGTFVAMNNKVSQSVPHLHVHVVPRRKGDGLKGFFWPRTSYASDEEMQEIAGKIAAVAADIEEEENL
jgi:histidine triad (HIT) family protein